MKNCLVIQRQWQGILLSGNSKSKYIDVNIPVLIKDEGNKVIRDLMTKEKCYAKEVTVPLSELKDFKLKNDNKKFYLPDPTHVPLLPEHRHLMKGVSQTDGIKVMTVDIETMSNNGKIFDPLHNPIVSIGIKRGNSDTVVLHYYDELEQDKRILSFFRTMFLEYDPDIVMCYNAHFDIPYILSRMAYHHIPIDIGRGYDSNRKGLLPRIWNKSSPDRILKLCDERNMSIMRDLIPGRIIYDVFLDSMKDQSLTGKVKNRKLKTIADYFGFGGFMLEEQEYKNMHELIGTQKLIDYNKSDVEVTHRIGNEVYLPVHRKQAEIMDLPLGNVINCYPSYIPSVYSMRELHSIDMYPFEKNKDRYQRYSDFDYKESSDSDVSNTDVVDGIEIIDLQTNDGDFIPSKYEAAIVYQSDKNIGYIDKVWKVDYSGYYPSAIMTLNLGPETTKLVEFQDYTEDGYNNELINDGKTLRMTVPDKTYQRNVVIDVDQTKESFFKKILLQMKEARAGTKEKVRQLKLENAPEDDINNLNAYQLAIKVIMNTFYGATGNDYSYYGDLATAIAIVGFCRQATMYACEEIIGFDNIIEIDTDGMYVCADIDVDMLNREIGDYVERTFKCKSHLSMDKDEFGRGIFLKKKQYVLEDLHGNIKFTGSSMKGSSKPLLFDKAKKRITNVMIENDPDTDYFDLVSELMDLSTYKWPDDFIITLKVKPKEKYNTTSFMYKLITECERYQDVEDNIVEFVYTSNGKKPVQSLDKSDTYDYEKYTEVVKSILRVFGLEKYTTMQMDLF